MKLTPDISKRNFRALLWHGGFLAFAQAFMDVDTIIPAMLIDAGGNAIQVGILTAILLGGASFTQLIYAPFISNFRFKRKFLLLGINSRVFALLALAILLYNVAHVKDSWVVLSIFLIMGVFSFGGAFANVGYTDILGKSIQADSRKSFFPLKQVITGTLLFISALLAKQVLNASDYPTNYAYMFFVAFGALFFASLGFWQIREVVPSKMAIKSAGDFFQKIKTELRENKKLKYYLGFINTMGISLAFLPFVVLYAKESFTSGSVDTGSLLLFKIIGNVVTAFLLFFLRNRYKYRYLLYGDAALAITIPLLILLFPQFPLFPLLFFIGGIIFAGYTITKSGILLEVSGTENRTLYAGIIGMGNILPALFPLLAGWLIKAYGFQPFFILYMVVILCSLFFIYKIDCKQ
jgi:MFS family permease